MTHIPDYIRKVEEDFDEKFLTESGALKKAQYATTCDALKSFMSQAILNAVREEREHIKKTLETMAVTINSRGKARVVMLSVIQGLLDKED